MWLISNILTTTLTKYWHRKKNKGVLLTRLFLAVPVRLYNYGQIQKDFAHILEGKWRDEEHLHVTIAFLGKNFEPGALIEQLSSFDWSFHVSELTTFDYFDKSRVLVALTQNSSLNRLYERLQSLLGLEDSTLFPHVTLIRVKKITDTDLFFKRLQTSQAKTIGILESKVALYQSTLHSDGARYEVLQEWHT
jgi:2'-5' RNA ligase